MAFKLDGKLLQVGVAFTHDDIQYPANWLRFATEEDKKNIGITEEDDPKVYDSRFYFEDGTEKKITDTNEVDSNGDPVLDENGDQVVTLGLKSLFKAQEKIKAGSLLAKYDWYVVRKSEKSTAIPTTIQTYRDAVRTACDTREKEIDACSDLAALITLYETPLDSDGKPNPNMTQYPEDPNS